MSFGDLKVQDLIYEDSSNNEITVVIADLATKNNPVFTGIVTVPTAPASDVSTKAASTAFVDAYYASKAAPAFTGSATGVNLTLSGNLVVNGTTTTINTQTLDVEDINITLGKVSTPSDTTANNGGITLKGASDKTFNWLNATDAWTSSEHIHLLNTKNLILGTDSRGALGYNSTTSIVELANRNTYLQLSDNGTAPGLILFKVDDGNQFFINERGFVAPGLGTVGMQWAPAASQDIVLGVRARGSNTSNVAVVDLTSSHPNVTGADVKYGKIRFSWDNTPNVHDNGTAIIEGCSGAASSSADRATALKFYTAPTGSAGSYAALPVERLRIWKDGQLGIGGANYGSSGEVLTSGGSGAAPSWAAVPAGGNAIELQADGAIAAGKPCIITTAGKAAQIVQTSTTTTASTMFNNVSAVQILSNSNSQYPCIVFDPNNNYAVQIASVGGAVKAQCLFLNSSQVVTAITGSEATIAAAGNEVHAIWDETGDRVIVAYHNTNSNRGEILSGRFTSASAVTWYGPYTYQTSGGEHPNVCHDTSSGKTLISYKNSGNLLKAKTMTLTYQTTGTGDTASFGSIQDIGNNGAGTQVGVWPRAVRVGASKFVVVAKNDNGSGWYTRAVVMSITSGTSLTGSGSIQVSGSNYEEAHSLDNGSHDVLYDSHNDKIIISYIRQTDYNAAWGRVGSVSGTSISWDAAEKRVTIWQGSDNQNIIRLRVLYEPFGKTGYMFYYKNHNSGISYDVLFSGRLSYDASDANKLDISNHDHATNTPNNLDTISQPTVLGNLGKILVPVNDVSSTNENYVFSFPSLTSTTTSTNATASNVIGFAEDAINDTATGTIKLAGNVVGNQSGLTAGTAYYVQANGTLGTSQDGVIGAATGFSKAGVALSATSLKISDYA